MNNPNTPTFDYKKIRSNADTYKSLFSSTDKMGNTIGAKFISINKTECIYEYTVKPEHYNPNGILHGGALFTAMDSAQGAFLHFIIDEQFASAVTGTATVRYEAALKSGTVSIRTFLEKQEGRKYFVTSLATQDSKPVARLDEVWIALK